MTFDEFDLNPELRESIDYMGFRETTPVQEKAIPVILAGDDLIACAQTGTGKTAAYLIPILNFITEEHTGHTHTLILVPTRELAIQIDQQIQGLAYTLNITSLAVYGGGIGSAWDQEKAALSKGADIIVANADLPYVYRSLLPDKRKSARLDRMKYSCLLRKYLKLITGLL